MATSSPQVTAPAVFPPQLAWLQSRLGVPIRPYHLTVALVVGLISAVFGAVIAVVVLIATNFNVLGWME